MEINKQLFEDVLSGKLKGTFVLRNGEKIPSDALVRRNRCFYALNMDEHLYFYYNDGRYSSDSETRADIIDFIPNTDMKENELTIEIPDNKVVDWDESKKQNKIVLKDKQLTYEDICKKLMGVEYYYITSVGWIHRDGGNLGYVNSNAAASEHQLECILAKNKLATVATYLNDGWKPIKGMSGWIIGYDCYSGYYASFIQSGSLAFKCYGLVIFKSKELVQQAIDILGEDTIKLAIEPLGF